MYASACCETADCVSAHPWHVPPGLDELLAKVEQPATMITTINCVSPTLTLLNWELINSLAP